MAKTNKTIPILTLDAETNLDVLTNRYVCARDWEHLKHRLKTETWRPTLLITKSKGVKYEELCTLSLAILDLGYKIYDGDGWVLPENDYIYDPLTPSNGQIPQWLCV